MSNAKQQHSYSVNSTKRSQPVIKTFRQTSDAPYDRHHYVLYYKDGTQTTFDDWLNVQAKWFEQCQLNTLDRVEVIDKIKRTQPKGFNT